MPQASGSPGCGRLVGFQTCCSILWSGFKLWIGSDRVVCLNINSLGMQWQEPGTSRKDLAAWETRQLWARSGYNEAMVKCLSLDLFCGKLGLLAIPKT